MIKWTDRKWINKQMPSHAMKLESKQKNVKDLNKEEIKRACN